MTECLEIAVVGSGIAGMSAAWLLSRRHRLTMYEADDWIGGHSHTVQAGEIPVDTGFIVYNERTYPNLTALFAHLGVATKPTDMGFAASLGGGRLEYAGTGLAGLFAQKRNLVRPRFWSMLRDLLRFYREAPRDLAGLGAESLGGYLDRGGYGTAFRADHLYPMAAAIWSTPVTDIGDYPASAFIRFCVNHGLLEADLAKRPVWRTVDGGSREYVRRLTAPFAERIISGCPVRSVRRVPGGADVVTDAGTARFDHVVMATHADQALRLLEDADPEERAVLGAFGYRRNEAVLHTDATLMPRRRAVWSAWNYVADGQGTDASLCVTYWMNRLQGIDERSPLFVTLNPRRAPAEGSVIRTDMYEHPVFDAAAVAAQARLWGLQCVRRTWFCGAYFGAGFHEDGLQAGLAVAEQLGGVRRPWNVAEESGRIRIGRAAEAAELAAA